jgi:repressor LexA
MEVPMSDKHYGVYEKLCKEKGVTNYRVYKDTGIPQSSLSDWKNGKLYPSTGMLEILSRYFGVSIDYLLGNTKAPKPSTPRSYWIPVLGKVAAGIPLDMVEEILDYEEIPIAMGECFALRIQGDSMSPDIPNGSTVIVRKQDDVESGEIAIVAINGEDATCKRVIKHELGITLASLNPSFEPMVFGNHDIEEMPIRILGRVMEVRRRF